MFCMLSSCSSLKYMTQPCNYVNFVEMIQTMVDMMLFDAGNKMSNEAAVVGWSLLGESTGTSCPASFLLFTF